MSSAQNDFSGNYFVTPDHPVGFGTLITNPSQILSDMVAGGIYFQQHGADNDIILVSAEKYLLICYQSLQVQKLLMSFTARMTEISGQQRVMFVHRSLAISLSFSEALKSIGIPANNVPNDWSNLTAINQALAPYYIQVLSTL